MKSHGSSRIDSIRFHWRFIWPGFSLLCVYCTDCSILDIWTVETMIDIAIIHEITLTLTGDGRHGLVAQTSVKQEIERIMLRLRPVIDSNTLRYVKWHSKQLKSLKPIFNMLFFFFFPIRGQAQKALILFRMLKEQQIDVNVLERTVQPWALKYEILVDCLLWIFFLHIDIESTACRTLHYLHWAVWRVKVTWIVQQERLPYPLSSPWQSMWPIATMISNNITNIITINSSKQFSYRWDNYGIIDTWFFFTRSKLFDRLMRLVMDYSHAQSAHLDADRTKKRHCLIQPVKKMLCMAEHLQLGSKWVPFYIYIYGHLVKKLLVWEKILFYRRKYPFIGIFFYFGGK